MFGKISIVWNLFRQGEAVANPAAWHDASAQGQRIGALLLLAISALKAFGYDLPVDEKTAYSVGLGLAAFVAWLLNNIATPHGGFLPAKPAAVAVPSPEPSGPAPVMADQPADAGVQPVDQPASADSPNSLA